MRVKFNKKFALVLLVATINSTVAININADELEIYREKKLDEAIEFNSENYKSIATVDSNITLEERSKFQIVEQSKNLAHSGIEGSNFSGSKYSVTPQIVAPYISGELTDEYLNDGLNAINMVRYIAGLPADIELNSDYTNYAQHGAVLLAALNTLTHYPDKPTDMNEDFYNLAYTGTRKSNIAAGWGYNGNLSIAKTIMLYMDDSDKSNIGTLGHRRWLLNPDMKYTGLGYASNDIRGEFSACYAHDKSREEYINFDYITWPAINNHPIEYFDSDQAWSISLNTYKYQRPNIEDIEVVLTRVWDNRVWTFSQNSSDGYFNVNNGGYGISNAIIFRPYSMSYLDGWEFKVEINGIKDYSGNECTITYNTEFFYINRNKDLNYDDKIDIEDLALCAVSYNKSSGQDNYNDEADFNRDEFIDLFDLVEIGKLL